MVNGPWGETPAMRLALAATSAVYVAGFATVCFLWLRRRDMFPLSGRDWEFSLGVSFIMLFHQINLLVTNLVLSYPVWLSNVVFLIVGPSTAAAFCLRSWRLLFKFKLAEAMVELHRQHVASLAENRAVIMINGWYVDRRAFLSLRSTLMVFSIDFACVTVFMLACNAPFKGPYNTNTFLLGAHIFIVVQMIGALVAGFLMRKFSGDAFSIKLEVRAVGYLVLLTVVIYQLFAFIGGDPPHRRTGTWIFLGVMGLYWLICMVFPLILTVLHQRKVAEAGKLKLETLLADPIGLSSFLEFAKTEFSTENVLFWAAVNDLLRQSAQAGVLLPLSDELSQDKSCTMPNSQLSGGGGGGGGGGPGSGNGVGVVGSSSLNGMVSGISGGGGGGGSGSGYGVAASYRAKTNSVAVPATRGSELVQQSSDSKLDIENQNQIQTQNQFQFQFQIQNQAMTGIEGLVGSARRICEEYVRIGSPREVNIAAKTRAAIIDAVDRVLVIDPGNSNGNSPQNAGRSITTSTGNEGNGNGNENGNGSGSEPAIGIEMAVLNPAQNQNQIQNPWTYAEVLEEMRCFKAAQNQVYVLMQRDSFPRYLQTALAAQYKKERGDRFAHTSILPSGQKSKHGSKPSNGGSPQGSIVDGGGGGRGGGGGGGGGSPRGSQIFHSPGSRRTTSMGFTLSPRSNPTLSGIEGTNPLGVDTL